MTKTKVNLKSEIIDPTGHSCKSFKGHSTICGKKQNWLYVLFIGPTHVRLCKWIVCSAWQTVCVESVYNICLESDYETRLFDPLNKRCYEKLLGNHYIASAVLRRFIKAEKLHVFNFLKTEFYLLLTERQIWNHLSGVFPSKIWNIHTFLASTDIWWPP